MAIDLTGRVCLITGAAQGVGAALVQGLAERGALVIATDLKAPQHECAALNLAWDITQPWRAAEVVQRVVEQFGRLDAFIANAGAYPRQPWQDISTRDWRDVLAINLDGAWYGAQAAAEVMTKQGYGKIVTVSSIEVRLGVDVHSHYDAAKAGVIGLTRSLARSLGPQGVRVNCVMLGAVLTEGELRLFPDQEAVAEACAKLQCLPERLTAEMTEPTFAFLCSSESDAVTGQVINVDHGWVLY